MPIRAEVEPQRRFIRLTYAGAVSPAELVQALEAALQLSRETGLQHLLADCLELAGGHSVLDLLGLISLMEARQVPHTLREAILLPAARAPQQDVAFYETACLNRGYRVRVFTAEAAAVDWLLSPAGETIA